jgi:hypothetical protein
MRVLATSAEKCMKLPMITNANAIYGLTEKHPIGVELMIRL